ncbi:MAG: hypothetical protein IKJ75_03030 [Clostridia bacterium]|nr:hypothetical protein [Clostridia bacterium]
MNIKYVPDFNPTGENEGILALTYDSIEIRGKKTKVFAYLGIPENIIPGTKIPAVVLVHGGCGYAFPQWVKEWNKRGYAAISICTVGLFPKKVNAGVHEGCENTEWTRNLEGIFADDDYTVAPYNDDMQLNDTQSLDDMWMHHAIIQTLRAYDVITSMDCVDKHKVGAVGISWGAVILSLALGYDNHFAFAIPVYGSGYLNDARSFMKYKFTNPVASRLWLAQDRFDNVKLPVLWLCMNNDTCFSINSNSKSFLHTFPSNRYTQLSIKSGWVHGHSCCWDENNFPCHEIYRYADAMTKDKGLFSYASQEICSDSLTVIITPETSSDTTYKATLYYQTDHPYEYVIPEDITKSYLPHEWKTAPAVISKLDGGQLAASAKLPDNVSYFYMEISVDANGKKYVISSSFHIKDV